MEKRFLNFHPLRIPQKGTLAHFIMVAFINNSSCTGLEGLVSLTRSTLSSSTEEEHCLAVSEHLITDKHEIVRTGFMVGSDQQTFRLWESHITETA